MRAGLKNIFWGTTNNYLVVSVATRFLRDWIVSRYLDEILKIVKKQIREISRIEFRIEDKEHEKDKQLIISLKKMTISLSLKTVFFSTTELIKINHLITLSLEQVIN